MIYFEELNDLFDKLTPKEKRRVIYRFVLNIPVTKLASLENISEEAIFLTFRKANKKLLECNNHDEMIASLQELFCNN